MPIIFIPHRRLLRGEAPQGVHIRAGGMVVEGSVQRSPNSLDVQFAVTDGASILVIQHSGILPDLFDEGEAAIAAGVIDENQVLQATEVLAKHDEKYTPPEVADAMTRPYQRKQEYKQTQKSGAQ
jgi:cytochrome c-type biogenesis protein CcmE